MEVPVSEASTTRLRVELRGLWLPAFVAVSILWIRLAALDVFPPAVADEGGWPLNVRLWVADGLVTKDYFTAPAYHWLLGIPFRLFEPSLGVARRVSAVAGLVSLVLLYGVALRVSRDRVTAAWAAVLLGFCYPAVVVDRRGLIEPIQTVWLLATVFFFAGDTRRDRWGLAVATCGLFLTKVSAAFILPALSLAALVEKRGSPLASHRWAKLGALWAGAGASGLGFALLFAGDPVLFSSGWETAAQAGTSSSVLVRAGRFGVDPLGVWEGMRTLTEWAPFLTAFGVAAAVRSIWHREGTLVGAWVGFGLLWLLGQLYRLDNHWAVLFPGLALGTALLLRELERAESPRRFLGAGLTGSRIVLVLIVGYSASRIVGGLVTARDPSRAAVEWLKTNVQPDHTVVAAPYVLMQVPGHPVSFFDFERHAYVPNCESLHRVRATWVVVDRMEWMEYGARMGHGGDVIDLALRECAGEVYRDSSVVMYRLSGGPSDSPR
jgi:hypothetical protein